MPRPVVATLRRLERPGFVLWLVPALAAAVGAAVLRAGGPDPATARAMVFVGGPLLLLAGLHARLDGYLHAPMRLRLLPRPLPAEDHWAAAAAPHRQGQWLTGSLGAGAVAVAVAGWPAELAWGLVADLLWLWLMAVLVEPMIPAVGALLGRRFDEARPEHRWQQRLGGGWTIPEAVVHLYAPAFGVGLAALLAMPGQLWLDRTMDGHGSPPVLLGVALGALAVAAGLGAVARRLYERGMFGAVPWVHEAVRTLAGPPVPEAVPGWMLWGRDPLRHLVLRQLWRTTPVPGLRLLVLLGGAAWIAAAAPPSVPAVAIGLALVAVWLVPATRLRTLTPARARLCASLPLPAAGRRGRSWSAWAVVGAPVALAVTIVAVAWSRAA